MSLIHQALKKAQIPQDTDVLAADSEQGKGHIYFHIPAARARFIFIVFLFIAFFAGWWIADRIGLFAPQKQQPRLKSPEQAAPVQRIDAAASVKNSGMTALNQTAPAGGERGNRFEAELEAARTQNLKGIELYQHGKISLALNEFLASIKTFPEYAEAYNNLGLTYKQLGDMKRAEDSYNKALRYKSDYPEAMNNYGVFLEAKGNSKAAQEYFKKAILTKPDYPDPYLNMAISLEKDRRFNEAITYYEGFLSHSTQGDDLLGKGVSERILYLRLKAEEN
ncbi:MAG: tetratricopeptide repeat protein [Deltaproteobacteria bacterium]|nr:tetratricopeptide repeat protein [Deltaproteobacteria bacterium]